MGWILVPALSKKCEDFIKSNPNLKISKFICRKGDFIFYRTYTNVDRGVKQEYPEFRIILVRDEHYNEGWCVSYMRHTGKWQDLPIFGDFDYCLDGIKSGKWGVLNPLQ